MLIAAIGRSGFRIPYAVQSTNPSVYNTYLIREISFVDFVCQLLIIWGINETKTNIPAKKPIMLIKSNISAPIQKILE